MPYRVDHTAMSFCSLWTLQRPPLTETISWYCSVRCNHFACWIFHHSSSWMLIKPCWLFFDSRRCSIKSNMSSVIHVFFFENALPLRFLWQTGFIDTIVFRPSSTLFPMSFQTNLSLNCLSHLFVLSWVLSKLLRDSFCSQFLL